MDKLTFILGIAAAIDPGFGALVAEFKGDVAAGKFTVKEGVTLAENVAAYVGTKIPARGLVLTDFATILGDLEAAYDKIAPDVEKALADLKAAAATPARV